MRQKFTIMLLFATLNSFGQNLYYDFKRDDYPDLKILCLDSINSVNVYKSEAFFTFSSTPVSKGELLYHIILDNKHRKSEIINYNTKTGNLEAKYIFDYPPDSIEKITMLNANDKISHYWIRKNGKLIEELKYNFKQDVTDKWNYSYINDTLIETITKHNKQDNVMYEIKYKYDSLNRLIEKKEYRNDSLVDIRKMIYDTSGKVIRIKFYPLKVGVWSSGNKTRVVTKSIPDENTLAYHFIEIQYDSIARVLKKTIIRNDSAIEYYETYFYQPSGKLKEITEYNKYNKPTRKQVYEYNDFGRETGYFEYERIAGNKLNPMLEMKITENKSGNIEKVELISRNSYNKKTVLYTYEYK